MEGDAAAGEATPTTANISIHTLRVEGDHRSKIIQDGFWISIHTLRVEGDHISKIIQDCFWISIHTLRVEGDRQMIAIVQSRYTAFQSTPSAWRVTMSWIRP